MKNLIRSLVLTFAFGIAAATAAETRATADCYRDVCVGDAAINISRDYREVTVVGIDNFGKFVVRFLDNGGIGGNWNREDLALMRGCAGDLCVGYPAINVSRDYRRVKIHALQWDGKYVLRFDDHGGVGGNWNRPDLAVEWGCVGTLCVNDVVYNRTNNREATIVAIQTNITGIQDRMVLGYPTGLGGNWGLNDLVLLRRGPTAYPPGPPVPPVPYCPPGTHYDSRSGQCVRDLPPPPPACPPGTHYDPRIGRCVSNTPPPPPPRDWLCQITKPGRVFTGRGPTRAAATQAVLTNCARTQGGYVCRASEAFCRN